MTLQGERSTDFHAHLAFHQTTVGNFLDSGWTENRDAHRA
jgi:hypothetical protein